MEEREGKPLSVDFGWKEEERGERRKWFEDDRKRWIWGADPT
jgi:hypothetical protein